ncbi:MAG: magnesium transporter [Balneola sp.]|nr:magnesium transporter [Balneola sp.]MBE78167.1 magnesium transporter [Balneola sp.]HBX67464.1 magnesium transporter [Balneolaceae bacterium]
MDVGIALILGGILGFEREWKRKPAGLKTNMIISGSAALLVSLGRVVIEDFSQIIETQGMGVDPIRMVHAVIVGVSFIGAGTILKSSSETVVRYLTTAATILMAAGVGVSIALKQYWLGVGVTFLLVVVNFLFGMLTSYIAEISDYESPYSE